MPLYIPDLDLVRSALRELYEIVVSPPRARWSPPEWWSLWESYCGAPSIYRDGDPPKHAYLIQAARWRVLRVLNPGGYEPLGGEFPEIIKGDLSAEQKVALLTLARVLDGGGPVGGRTFILSALDQPEHALMFCDLLQKTLAALGSSKSEDKPANEADGHSGATPGVTPHPEWVDGVPPPNCSRLSPRRKRKL
jgi:hypothetical protein